MFLKRVLPVKTIYPTVPGSVPLLGLFLPGPARPFEYLNAEYGYFENYFPQKNTKTIQNKQRRTVYNHSCRSHFYDHRREAGDLEIVKKPNLYILKKYA